MSTPPHIPYLPGPAHPGMQKPPHPSHLPPPPPHGIPPPPPFGAPLPPPHMFPPPPPHHMRMHHPIPPPTAAPHLVRTIVPPPVVPLSQQQQQQQATPTPVNNLTTPPTALLIDKKTTIVVRNINEDTDNDFIVKLLEACGQVDQWKRFKDPNTGIYKKFGFCDFHSAEGALRALRLLNGLEVEGSKLELKIDEKTRIFLNDYEKRKLELWGKEQRQAAEKNDNNNNNNNNNSSDSAKKDNTDVDTQNDQKEKKVSEEKATTSTTVNQRAAIEAGVSESEKESLDRKLQGEDKEAFEIIQGFLQGKTTVQSESERKKYESELMAVQNTVERMAREGAPVDEVDEKRQFLSDQIRKFRELEKEREREKVQREKEKERQKEKEKRRQIEKEQERERRRRRLLEMEEERERKRKERELRELQRAERERELNLQKSGTQVNSSSSSDDSDSERGKNRHKKKRHHTHKKYHKRDKYSSGGSAESSDDERRKRRRLMKKEKSKYYSGRYSSSESDLSDDQNTKTTTKSKKLEFGIGQKDDQTSLKISSDAKTSTSSPHNNHTNTNLNTSVSSIFQQDDEEDASISKNNIKKLDFEAIKRQQELQSNLNQVSSQNEQKQSDQSSLEKLDPKNIAKEIPSDKESLFSPSLIQWDIIDKYSLADKLTGWISSTITDFFGEEDKTVVEFILGNLRTHAKPEVLLEELVGLMEDEGEKFVIKLWKMLIFEQIKALREIQIYGHVTSS